VVSYSEARAHSSALSWERGLSLPTEPDGRVSGALRTGRDSISIHAAWLLVFSEAGGILLTYGGGEGSTTEQGSICRHVGGGGNYVWLGKVGGTVGEPRGLLVHTGRGLYPPHTFLTLPFSGLHEVTWNQEK
jgi:hypothetical protein